jgi:tetratricopeptide (TPR) repeat protein
MAGFAFKFSEAATPASEARMACTKRAVRFTAILCLLAVLPACSRGRASGQHSRDLQHFEGAIEHGRTTTDMVKSDLYVRASRALESGDAGSAESLYREVISKYPEDTDGYEALGACLYFQGKQEEAKSEYLRALDLNATSIDALYGLGCVAQKQKDYYESRDYLEKALAVNANDAPSHRVLAMVYDHLGDKSKAVFHFQRAIELEPGLPNADYVRQRLDVLRE